jgi:hypothetical protein
MRRCLAGTADDSISHPPDDDAMTTVNERSTTTSRGAAITAAVTGPLLLVVSFAQPPDGPDVATATAAQIRTWALSQATALRIGALGGMLALALLLIFTAALTRILRDARPHALLADAFAGASWLLIVALFLNTTAAAVPTVLPDLIGADTATVDDQVLRGWYGITGFTHLLGDFQLTFIALLVGAFSLAALQARLVARWVGWLGAAVTVAAALGVAGVTTNTGPLYGFWMAGIFGWVVWTAVVGVALGLRARAGRRAGPGGDVLTPSGGRRSPSR